MYTHVCIFAYIGIVYFSLAWEDSDDCVLYPADQDIDVTGAMVDFIDRAMVDGVSVLISSVQGRGRSAAACVTYLMYRYAWGFDKAHNYLLQRKPDVCINGSFVQQLFSLERKQLMERVKDCDEKGKKLILTRMRDWDVGYIKEMKKDVQRGSPLEELLDEEMLLVCT